MSARSTWQKRPSTTMPRAWAASGRASSRSPTVASSRPSRSSRSSGRAGVIVEYYAHLRGLSVPTGGHTGYCSLHTPGHFRTHARRLILLAMSGFVVDSRTLVAVRDTLGRLQDQLVGMHTVIWHQWGTVGGQALESELEHFCGTWHYGVSELGGPAPGPDAPPRRGGRGLRAHRAAHHPRQRRISPNGRRTSASPTGSGHTSTSTHHAAAKHASSEHRTAKHSAARYHSNPSAPGGTHYSGGAGLAPPPPARALRPLGREARRRRQAQRRRQASGRRLGDDGDRGRPDHNGGAKHDGNSGSGSGTTVIGGGGGGGSRHEGGTKRNGNSGSGSGTTVIGGGPGQAAARAPGRAPPPSTRRSIDPRSASAPSWPRC